MNKKEFKELDREQMIIAFNQLKDDYSSLFDELEQEKEKNKTKVDIKDIEFSNFIKKRYVSKDKIKEIQGQLCMQLGSYVRNEASPEQERIAGGINIINKILEV